MFRRQISLLSSSSFLRPTFPLFYKGRVIEWINLHGYGFIKKSLEEDIPEDRHSKHNERYFVHNKDCIFKKGEYETHRSIEPGTPVEFDLEADPRDASGRLRCVNVTLLKGKPLPSGPTRSLYAKKAQRVVERKHTLPSGTERVRGFVTMLDKNLKCGFVTPILDEKNSPDFDLNRNKTAKIRFYFSDVDVGSMEKLGLVEEKKIVKKKFVRVEEKKEQEVQASTSPQQQQQNFGWGGSASSSSSGWGAAAPSSSTTSSWGNATTSSSATQQKEPDEKPKKKYEEKTIETIVKNFELQDGDEVIFDVVMEPDRLQIQRQKYREKRKLRRQEERFQSMRKEGDIGASLIEDDVDNSLTPASSSSGLQQEGDEGDVNDASDEAEEKNIYDELQKDDDDNIEAGDVCEKSEKFTATTTSHHTKIKDLRNNNNTNDNKKNSSSSSSSSKRIRYQTIATNIKVVNRPRDPIELVGMKKLRGEIEFISTKHNVKQAKDLAALADKFNVDSREVMKEIPWEKRKKLGRLSDEQAKAIAYQHVPALPWGKIRITMDHHSLDEKFNALGREQKEQHGSGRTVFRNIGFQLSDFLSSSSSSSSSSDKTGGLVAGATVEFDVQVKSDDGDSFSDDGSNKTEAVAVNIRPVSS